MKTIRIKDIVDRMPTSVRTVIRQSGLDQNAALVRRAVTVADEQVTDIDEKKRTATIYLSTRHVDAAGDVVTPTGWNLKVYDMNPKGLWSHQMMELPVYKALWTMPDNIGLKQKIEFAETDFAEDVWMLFKGGFLRTFSAGFMRNKGMCQGEQGFNAMLDKAVSDWPELRESRDKVRQFITDKTLFESSIVNLPCNPYAMAIEIEKGNVSVCDTTRNILGVEAILQENYTGKRWVTINGRHVEIDDETGDPVKPLPGDHRGESAKPSGGEKPSEGAKKPAGGKRGDEDGGRRTSYDTDEQSDRAYFRREQARADAAVSRAKAALEAHRANSPAELARTVDRMKGELAEIQSRKAELARQHAASVARLAELKEKLDSYRRRKKGLVEKADEDNDASEIESQIEALLEEMAKVSKEMESLADAAEAIADKAGKKEASEKDEKSLAPVRVVPEPVVIRVVNTFRVKAIDSVTEADISDMVSRAVERTVRKMRGAI